MSAKYVFKAWETEVGNPIRKLVLVKLADNANDEGLAWPSISTISKGVEASKSTVITHLRALEDMGLISREKRHADNGRNTSNKYRMCLWDSPAPALGSPAPALGDSPAPAPSYIEPTILEPNKEQEKQEKEVQQDLFSDNQQTEAPSRFDEFWDAYPTGRKARRKECLAKWKARNLDQIADMIIEDVNDKKARDVYWIKGFEPGPLPYINGDRWEDTVKLELPNRGSNSQGYAPPQQQYIPANEPTPQPEPDQPMSYEDFGHSIIG